MNLGMLVGYLFVGAAVGIYAALERREEPLKTIATLLFWMMLGPVVLGIIALSWIFAVAAFAITDRPVSIYRH